MHCDILRAMNLKRLFIPITAFILLGNVMLGRGPAQSSHPDLSGKWTLIEGDPGADSPLGNEGSIIQDASAVTFQAPKIPLKVPFDGSTTTRQDSAFVWQYEGRWVGFAFVVSMKAGSGLTPANFTDLMVVSPTSADTMTMVLMRTPKAGKVMIIYTLKYRKG
jgi:hypothetical protein